MAKALVEKLPEILIQSGCVQPEQMEKALAEQREQGGGIVHILLDKGLVQEKMLVSCIAEQMGIMPIDLTKFKPLPEVLELVSRQVANYYKVIPIAQLGRTLSLAMVDPLDVLAIDDIRLITGLEVQAMICSAKDFRESLDNYYATKANMEGLLSSTETPRVELRKMANDQDINIDELLIKTGEVSIIKIVNLMLVQAIKDRASDIHIEPFEKEIKLRYRIDGVLYDSTPPPKSMQAAIVSRIKIMSNLDIAERRLPQDGRFMVRVHGREIDFRVSSLPTSFGEKVVMRVLDKSGLESLDIDKLGFHKQGLEGFMRALSSPYGIILLTGPTGSGKSTTLYTALRVINKPQINIVTVEDPVEYQMEGINQVAVNPDIGLTFAAGLRSILRQDPDVIMVGEIRDFETADIAIKSALTGHLVLSTLHTNDAASAITRLEDMGIEPFLISSSTLLVAAQRLVRRICKKCKREAVVPEEALRAAQMKWEGGTPPKIYHGAGCTACKNTGYAGRMALIESITIDDDLRNLIGKKATSRQIKLAAMEKGMMTLRMVGMERVKEGSTTLEEVIRVTAFD
ncbi:MAG: ATPase, T2SS/T4P/T4SS family [Candidatus Aureabacteria bacterium]|nr:ATPase, T2SS/T4P/T4SS family [Candidatus Auribacterota bacterium]